MPQQPQVIAVDDLIRREALAAGVPPELALAVAEQESGFNPTAVNPTRVAGGQQATGTFQLLPSTAKTFGVDPTNPVQNIQGGVKYLRQLMDRHQGDLSKVLAEYGGVKTDTTYVPQVLGRIPKFASGGSAPPAAAPAAGPAAGAGGPGASPPPPPPGSFAANHPYLNEMVQGLDPHEQGGRRNIAGGIGGVIGGGVGAIIGGAGGLVAGAPTGPGAVATTGAGATWGAGVGSVAGAGLFGAAEDLLLEQTGIGPWIGRNLPWGSVDQPVQTLGPNATAGDRAWQAAGVGGEQAVYDALGQVVFAPLRYGARAALESRIGRAASDAIGARKQAAVAGLRNTVDHLRGAREAATVANAQTSRLLGDDVASQIAAAREAARLQLEGVRTAQGEAVTGAMADKRQAVRTAARTGMEERSAVQAEAAAAEAQARAAAEAEARVAAAQVEAAREAARVAVESTRTAAGEQVAEASLGKRQGVREAVKTGQAAREAAKREAEAQVEATRAAYQAKLQRDAEAGAVARPPLGTPSEVAAGRATSEVFEGPAREALDTAGRAVSEAAATGPVRSVSAVQAEARRILETELAPTQVGQPGRGAAGPRPRIGTKLREILARIDDAQLQELVKHPAVKVLSRILNMPEALDFATLHQIESQLRRSVQGSGDKVINSYVTDTTRHLVGLLRDTLAGNLEKGAAPHLPFEEATKRYADVVKLFTEGHA